MDNRKIDITSNGKDDFETALKLLMKGNKVIGYRVTNNILILYKFKSDKMIALPYEMTPQDAINFSWGWFDKSHPSKPQPDHDGDNDKGFHIYNESWGHILGEWQAFAAIEPIWAMHGK